MTPKTETARLTVDVALLSRGPDETVHVLLIQRRWDPFKGLWALPGGHVDVGEEVAAAAWRELFEETGLTAERLELINVYAGPTRDPRGRYVNWAFVGWALDSLPAPTAGDDAAEARWFSLREVGQLSLAFDHAQILTNVLGYGWLTWSETQGTGPWAVDRA